MREGFELAALLQRASRTMLTISDAFNWMFINFPQQPSGHWYMQLFPRLTTPAGFEMGTGSAINTVDAKTSADHFRYRRQ
jgi:galactose-1-phosphate uridylyltransferase